MPNTKHPSDHQVDNLPEDPPPQTKRSVFQEFISAAMRCRLYETALGFYALDANYNADGAPYTEKTVEGHDGIEHLDCGALARETLETSTHVNKFVKIENTLEHPWNKFLLAAFDADGETITEALADAAKWRQHLWDQNHSQQNQ